MRTLRAVALASFLVTLGAGCAVETEQAEGEGANVEVAPDAVETKGCAPAPPLWRCRGSVGDPVLYTTSARCRAACGGPCVAVYRTACDPL